MVSFDVTKVLRISAIRIIVIQIVIKKITDGDQSKLDVLCKMALLVHGVVEKRTTSHQMLRHNRLVKI